MKAPYTDQVAFGGDRQIANNFAVGFNLVNKRSGNLLGWRDIGGIYGRQAVALSDGRTLTVFPLLNRPADRIFLRTNGPGYWTNYKALILTASKRFSARWEFNAGYTRQRAEGRDLSSSGTAGQDPNDLINSYGGLGARDRPNMFTFMGSYEIPKIGVQVSANLTAVSGTAVASTAQMRCRRAHVRSISKQRGSRYPTESEQYMIMRITKTLFREGPRRLELAGEIKNALQEQGGPDIQTTVFNSANFLRMNLLPKPRQLRLFARWWFLMEGQRGASWSSLYAEPIRRLVNSCSPWTSVRRISRLW